MSSTKKMTRLMHHTAAIVAASSLLLSACAPAGQPAASGGGAPIMIGAIYSTTGPVAGLGQDEYDGAQIFVEEINAAGGILGRKIELVFGNDESKADVGLSIAKKIIEQDKVVGIVGPASVIIGTAVQPVADEKKIPMVSGMGKVGDISPYSYALFPIADQTVPFTKLAKEKGYTKVGVIGQAGPVAESIKSTVLPPIEKEMQLVGFEQIQPADTDMTPVLAKLKSLGAQMYFVPTTGQQVAIAAKNFKALGLQNGGIFTTTAQNANASLIDVAGDAADIINLSGTKIFIYKDLPDSDPLKAKLTKFADAYIKKTNRQPTLLSALGYDMVLSLTEAIKTANSTDGEKLKAALDNQKGLKTLTGAITRGPAEHNGMVADWVLMRIDVANKRFMLAK
ncbi:MAG: ABC transporter substrate-binding protein [Chloroflexota bacterium]